jgi:hypothetical protein
MITMPGEKPNRPATGRHYNLTLRVPKALFGFPGTKLVNNLAFHLNFIPQQSFPVPMSERGRNAELNPDYASPL